jgi:hypothetical protein
MVHEVRAGRVDDASALVERECCALVLGVVRLGSAARVVVRALVVVATNAVRTKPWAASFELRQSVLTRDHVLTEIVVVDLLVGVARHDRQHGERCPDAATSMRNPRSHVAL